ncbi:hypothetical protein D3C86_1698470 [compost metagenome]
MHPGPSGGAAVAAAMHGGLEQVAQHALQGFRPCAQHAVVEREVGVGLYQRFGPAVGVAHAHVGLEHHHAEVEGIEAGQPQRSQAAQFEVAVLHAGGAGPVRHHLRQAALAMIRGHEVVAATGGGAHQHADFGGVE